MGHSFQAARSSEATAHHKEGAVLGWRNAALTKLHTKLILAGLLTWDCQVKILFQITEVEVRSFFKSHIQNPKNYGHVLQPVT